MHPNIHIQISCVAAQSELAAVYLLACVCVGISPERPVKVGWDLLTPLPIQPSLKLKSHNIHPGLIRNGVASNNIPAEE